MRAIATNNPSPNKEIVSMELFSKGYSCSNGYKNPEILFCQRKKTKVSQYIVATPNIEIIRFLNLKIRIKLNPIQKIGRYIKK